MITKKPLGQQAYQVKFLSKLKFIIFYTFKIENRSGDLFIYYLDNWKVDDFDNQKQHLLQMIFLLEKLKISFIDPKKIKAIIEKIIYIN